MSSGLFLIFELKSKYFQYFSDVDYVDTWKAMEKLVEKGLVRSIGLSNFNAEQTERVLKICKIRPVVNEVSPFFIAF